MGKKYRRIVIGFDQSYTQTGISVCIDGKLVLVSSTNYKGLKTKSEKRKHLSDILTKLLKKASSQASEVLVICERIRTFNQAQSKGKSGGNSFGGGGLNPNYLKMTGALIATLVDTAYDYGVTVYSVDTRSWKSKVVGNSKARNIKGKRDAKGETVEFVQKLGFDLFIRTNKNGRDLYNDDAADSACIALYGFIPRSLQSLKEEE